MITDSELANLYPYSVDIDWDRHILALRSIYDVGYSDGSDDGYHEGLGYNEG